MATKLVWDGTNVEARWLHAPWYRKAQARTWDVQLYATTAYPAGVLKLSATVASWVYVSLDGGGSYALLPLYPAPGVALGAVSAGARIALKIKLQIPIGATTYSRRIGLVIDEGT